MCIRDRRPHAPRPPSVQGRSWTRVTRNPLDLRRRIEARIVFSAVANTMPARSRTKWASASSSRKPRSPRPVGSVRSRGSSRTRWSVEGARPWRCRRAHGHGRPRGPVRYRGVFSSHATDSRRETTPSGRVSPASASRGRASAIEARGPRGPLRLRSRSGTMSRHPVVGDGKAVRHRRRGSRPCVDRCRSEGVAAMIGPCRPVRGDLRRIGCLHRRGVLRPAGRIGLRLRIPADRRRGPRYGAGA